MSRLFKNAVESIQLGVEDYQENDSKRALSAVRNFYAGTLLLAKEVLVRKAPNADPEDVIATRFKPVLDGQGGLEFERDTKNTIDFDTIGKRFADFGLDIDNAALKDLNRIRTDIEHRYSDKPHEVVREAIAKAFPVVAQLFRLVGENPSQALGDSWQVVLDVRAVYEAELSACRKSFAEVFWPIPVLNPEDFVCPECGSSLVEQVDPENDDRTSLESRCRACAAEISPERVVETAVTSRFDAESYIAMTDGGDQPVHHCPDCGLETYVTTEDARGCIWCETVLGECAACSVDLTPDNVSPDNHAICGYCEHVMSKD